MVVRDPDLLGLARMLTFEGHRREIEGSRVVARGCRRHISRHSLVDARIHGAHELLL